jgi:hypothetical protein
MGTNYYLRKGEYDDLPEEFKACLTKVPSPAKLHIGKSSMGWCFSLRVHPTLGLNSLNDWLQYIPQMLNGGWVLENEYREEVTMERLLKAIMERGFHGDEVSNTKALIERASSDSFVHGPNGLARHKIDGKNCVGHGPGTWDLILGEFS